LGGGGGPPGGGGGGPRGKEMDGMDAESIKEFVRMI